MKVRNIVRKAAVLGSSAALVGTTLMGALAYDLGTYPAKFIADGQFDGKIVLGEKAAMVDMLGAVDIATGLQQAAVKKVPLPGQAGQVAVSGDAYQIGAGSDMLELRENLADVAEVVTGEDLKGLKSGKVSTSAGSTDYSQYIRFNTTSDQFQAMGVNYHQNSGESNEHMADFLVIGSATAPFIEWEIQFSQGLESDWEEIGTSGVGSLQDLEDKTINILGTDYTITRAEVTDTPQTDADDVFVLELMGGSLAKSLREGESETYNIDGVDYTVTLLFVSDPNSGDTEAKFSVNGELTRAMQEGDTETLSGGLQIGVRDILVNSREGVASFYLGANKVVFSDTQMNDSSFATGDVEINDDTTASGVFLVAGTFGEGVENEITSMRYQVAMESKEGGVAYIPAGHGVREYMDEPELLISDSLDLKYEGLTKPETKQLKVAPSGDDKYKLTFTNILGKEYKSVPFVGVQSGAIAYGDDQYDLHFAEADNIVLKDYLVVTDNNNAPEKRTTAILRYDDYKASDHTVTFIDLAGNDKISTVVDSTSGVGTLKVNGKSFDVTVADPAVNDDTVTVDMNGDGDYSDTVTISTWGGLYFKTWDSNVSNAELNWTLAVPNNLFDTTGTDDAFDFQITEANDELDLDFIQANIDGPFSGAGTSDYNEFDWQEAEDDSTKTVGMSDYGILITEDNPDNSNDPNTLTLDVPRTQRFAQVFVTLGSTTATEGDAGTADRINPIDLGLAIVDSDAEGLLGKENLIVVGGPCANTVAATLMESSSDNCAAGFEAGKAIIKAWDKGDTVAVLVAGYEAKETQVASRVLATKGAGKLSGSEVSVVVNSLTDYEIKSAS